MRTLSVLAFAVSVTTFVICLPPPDGAVELKFQPPSPKASIAAAGAGFGCSTAEECAAIVVGGKSGS